MKQIFVDTWYLIALTHKGDVSHKKATTIASRLGSICLVTSEGVLTEYLNFFSARGKDIKRAAISTVNILRAYGKLEVIHQDHAYFEKSLTLYKNREDKNYSLTDCFSMVIMKEMGISEVLTNDDGFKQEGYIKIYE
jgi:predicted nucleic acid-binding protein